MIRERIQDLLVCLGLLLSFCLCSCSPSPPNRTQDAASEVKAREIAFAQTMADRDFDAFLGFVSSEAVFFKGNEPLRGIEAVSQAWAPFF